MLSAANGGAGFSAGERREAEARLLELGFKPLAGVWGRSAQRAAGLLPDDPPIMSAWDVHAADEAWHAGRRADRRAGARFRWSAPPNLRRSPDRETCRKVEGSCYEGPEGDAPKR